jgi:hypothetical protein
MDQDEDKYSIVKARSLKLFIKMKNSRSNHIVAIIINMQIKIID